MMSLLSQGMTTSIDPDDMQHTGSTSCGSMADWVQDTGKLYLVAAFGKYGINFPEVSGQYVGFLEGVMD